jgi:small subunit ribosomal protein S9
MELAALQTNTTAQTDLVAREPKLDKQGRAYGTGRRKDSVARVWVKPGVGRFSVNGKELAAYFGRPTQQMIVNQPFDAVGATGRFDVYATVKGGGLSGRRVRFVMVFRALWIISAPQNTTRFCVKGDS